jgi:hypothetical protein
VILGDQEHPYLEELVLYLLKKMISQISREGVNKTFYLHLVPKVVHHLQLDPKIFQRNNFQQQQTVIFSEAIPIQMINQDYQPVQEELT